jgi:hypothetical protein
VIRIYVDPTLTNVLREIRTIKEAIWCASQVETTDKKHITDFTLHHLEEIENKLKTTIHEIKELI